MTDPSRIPTILCVDDELEFLKIQKEYFTERGFDVRTATNGTEALLQIAQEAPNAVILDLLHPGLGGVATLEQIRRLNPNIVVIVISGVLNALEMLEEAGVFEVAATFAKPVELDRILDALVGAGVGPPKTPREAAAGDPPN